MIDALRTLGLNQKEQEVYQACIRLGTARAREIAQAVQTDRQTIYYTLQLLEKKGLISETIEEGVKHFTIVDPKRILENIEEEHARKQEALQVMQTEFKKLENLQFTRPRVQQYEGFEGFKVGAREVIAGNDKEVYAYSSEKVMLFNETFLANYVAKRKDKNIKLKVITDNTNKMRSEARKDAQRDIRTHPIIENKDFSFAINKDAVIFIRANDKDQYGFKIEDPIFAAFQKELFKEFWKKSKKL